ncbi:MAG TPA: hypothetical protein PKM75_10810 [Prolixibacteraceae bacterium]|nr:hypothetical protein [Prolixibacteraceae bacterium]
MKFHHFSLADSLKKAQNWLLKKSTLKPVLFLAGLLATLWFLVRVIPKPSRAGYRACGLQPRWHQDLFFI